MTTYFIMLSAVEEFLAYTGMRFDRDMHKGRKGSQAPFSKAGSKTSLTNVFGWGFFCRSHLLGFFVGWGGCFI